jgi:fructose-1,6-bisphosphatase I
MSQSKDRDLALLMISIQLSCKAIARAVRKAGIAGLFGIAGSENASGDEQKKLDVLSNDIMVNALLNSHVCSILVTEENDEPIIVEANKSGIYISPHDFFANCKL